MSYWRTAKAPLNNNLNVFGAVSFPSACGYSDRIMLNFPGPGTYPCEVDYSGDVVWDPRGEPGPKSCRGTGRRRCSEGFADLMTLAMDVERRTVSKPLP